MFRKNRFLFTAFIAATVVKSAKTESKSCLHLTLLLLSVGMVFVSSMALGAVLSNNHLAYAAYIKATPASAGPTVNDPNLKVESVFAGGLQIPTSMAFLSPNDILVLEKNKGVVDRIVNDKIQPQPLLQIPNIANQEVEWGLLGIAVDKAGTDSSSPTYVFLCYTEKGSDGGEQKYSLLNYRQGNVVNRCNSCYIPAYR